MGVLARYAGMNGVCIQERPAMQTETSYRAGNFPRRADPHSWMLQAVGQCNDRGWIAAAGQHQHGTAVNNETSCAGSAPHRMTTLRGRVVRRYHWRILPRKSWLLSTIRASQSKRACWWRKTHKAIVSHFWNWLYGPRHNKPACKALPHKCARRAA